MDNQNQSPTLPIILGAHQALEDIVAFQGGDNGPSIRLRDELVKINRLLNKEEFEVRVCCGEYAQCSRPCTPRGRWEGSKEFAVNHDLLKTLENLVDEAVKVWEYPEDYPQIEMAISAIAFAKSKVCEL